LCGSSDDGNLSYYFTKIEKINNQMDKIKKLLVKIHALGVFAHKRLARGILLNHLEVITLHNDIGRDFALLS
jgi:hypothetical protein